MKWNTTRKTLITVYCIIGGVGLFYLLFMIITGHGLPCYYRLFTGKPCPFCGFSRMFFAFAKGDLTGAFAHHPVGAVLLPLWVGVSALLFWGKPKWVGKPAFLYSLLCISVLAVLIYGFLRNGTL